jgi:hypothetical protein
MATVRRSVRVVIQTTPQQFTPGTADPGFKYEILGSGEFVELTTPDTDVTFTGVISGPHTVRVSKLGVTISQDFVVPDDGMIDVPVLVTVTIV